MHLTVEGATANFHKKQSGPRAGIFKITSKLLQKQSDRESHSLSSFKRIEGVRGTHVFSRQHGFTTVVPAVVGCQTCLTHH